MQVIQVIKGALDGFGNRNRLGVGQGTEIAAGAADDVGQQADVRGCEAVLAAGLPEVIQVALAHVGQHQVLLVGNAQFAEAELVGQVGNGFKLLVVSIARGNRGRFQRQGDGGVARHLVRLNVAHGPVVEALFGFALGQVAGVIAAELLIGRGGEVAGNTIQLLLGQGGRAVLGVRPFGVDLLGEDLGSQRLDQNLDARLVLVVTTAIAVVHTQDGIEIGQQVLPWQKLADLRAHHRGAAEAATNQDAEADFASGVAHDVQTNVVYADGGTIRLGAVDCDLELARQEGKFGMESGPLTNDLAPRTRIDQLICGNAGKLVGGGVADTVAAGLNGMHLHFSQVGQNVRHILQGRPVELDVLAGAEVNIALVVGTGDEGQLAYLPGGNQPVGNGNAQHWGVALDVQAVLQSQRQELTLAQLACEKAAGLIAELLYAVLDDLLIIFVVDIHTETCSSGTDGPSLVMAHQAWAGRQ